MMFLTGCQFAPTTYIGIGIIQNQVHADPCYLDIKKMEFVTLLFQEVTDADKIEAIIPAK